MKRTSILVLPVVLVVLVLTSCGTLFTEGGSDYRSGAAAYEKQEYVTALRYLSQALAVNPEFVEAEELFSEVFAEGTSYYKNLAVTHEGIEDRQSADRVYYAYARLQQLHDIARNSEQKDLRIEDFTEAVHNARLASGDLWFAYAQTLQEQRDRESLKQAVAAFETARNRNPEIPNIDSLIDETLADATVTLAVLSYGPGEEFSQRVLDDVTKTLAGDRFVEVIQRTDFSPGSESFAGPMDVAIMAAMKEGWDYVLEIHADQDFDEINKRTQIQLPSENPLFSGAKRTIGYQEQTSISYSLLSIKDGVTTVFQDQSKVVDGPYEYTVSFVRDEGVRELNLEGTGAMNLRFVSSSASDTATRAAINSIRQDYDRRQIPAEIQNPTDQTQWVAYFMDKYDDFETFAANESGRELFYGIAVVHHRPSDSYFIIGPSLDEARRRSDINSAIMNALSHTGRNLVSQEKKDGGQGYLNAGNLAANAIKDQL